MASDLGKAQHGKSRQIARNSEFDQFCWVRLAHGSSIDVSVCVVAFLVRQNQCICELIFSSASGDLQMELK